MFNSKILLSLVLIVCPAINARVLEITSANLAEFKTQKKPLIIDFYAEWCAPCKQMSPIFEALSSELPDYTFARANIDNNSALANEYGIQSIPAFVVIVDNKVLGSAVGLMDKEGLKKAISDTILQKPLDLKDENAVAKKMMSILQSGTASELKGLLDLGVNIDMVLDHGFTPLFFAINFCLNSPGIEDKVRALLEAGAHLEVTTPHGVVPLVDLMESSIAGLNVVLKKQSEMLVIIKDYQEKAKKKEAKPEIKETHTCENGVCTLKK